MMKRIKFHYYNGEEVRKGDRVRFANLYGVVEEIFPPGSQLAKCFHASNGGVLIRFEGEEHAGMVLEPPDGLCWEDLELVTRAGSKGGDE